MPCGKLSLKASKPKLEKLLDRVRTREITVNDLMVFNEWAAQEHEFPIVDWCQDFGTFKAVGRGFELSTFLAQNQPCWGEEVTECPQKISSADIVSAVWGNEE
jgi:hypothetical protein